MAAIGYARVSKRDQNLDMQIEALQRAGCDKIFTDKVSGVKKLPEQIKMLEYLRPGDSLVVWRLDRLGRNTLELIKLVNNLKHTENHFVSLTEGIDTRTAGGEFIFTVFAGFAQLERHIIQERTNTGLESAREKGRIGGRPSGLSKKYKKIQDAVKAAHESGKYTRNQLLETFDIPSTNTLYRILKS